MGIVAYGLSFRTAPLQIREKVALPTNQLESILLEIKNQFAAITEIFALSTCNRTEFYYYTNDESSLIIQDWLSNYSDIEKDQLKELTYVHYGEEAARHLIRVSSGLDSQIIGEPQIMGQVKESFEKAKNARVIGTELELLFQITLNIAKKIRTETDIGQNPVSVAYSAVFLASKIFENLESKRALLIGAGETISLVTQHLKRTGIKDIVVTNRTHENALTLAKKYTIKAIAFSDLNAQLVNTDIIISSTGASETIINRRDIEAALIKRKRQPLFIVDIAVPRDVENSIAELPDVYLYTIDDLTNVINSNIEKREDAGIIAEQYALKGSKHYLREHRIKSNRTVLKSYRENIDKIRRGELSKISNIVITETNRKEVFDNFSQNLTNKLTHRMTTIIRNAIADGRTEILQELETLYSSNSDRTNKSTKNSREEHEPN